MMSDEDNELQSPSIVFQMHQSNAWQQYWSNISYILELGKKKKKSFQSNLKTINDISCFICSNKISNQSLQEVTNSNN